MSEIYFTPTECRILNVLADGLPHYREELMKCLQDELAAPVTLQNHISHIRKKLLPYQQTIVCEVVNRQIHYRHIIIFNGKK